MSQKPSMDSDYNIDVTAQGPNRQPGTPFITFHFQQFKPTSQLMTEQEIDDNVDLLLNAVEGLRRKAKEALLEAKNKS